MASLVFLPSTTYRPPPSSSGPGLRRRPSLNTIIEVDEDSTRGSNLASRYADDSRGRNRSPQDRSPVKASWLSPLSDNFPTPRGNHFMPTPMCPSTSSSDTESISEGQSSAAWTRQSFMTDATDFDDLYDASSDEDTRRKRASVGRRNSTRLSHKSNRSSTGSAASRASLSKIIIPSQGDPWPGVDAFKLLSSPIPPTPPPKVPMSPALFSYLQSQEEAPSCSAPPSLDGQDSDALSAISSCPTPDMGNNSEDEGEWGGGVHLQPEAMATLRALAGMDEEYDEMPTEQVIEVPSRENSPFREMQQSPPPLMTNIRRNNSITVSPGQQRSLNMLTKLDIPSPGGFFSALSPRARHTWHLVPCSPESAAPPSSSTAESFYKMPWHSRAPIEQIVEMSETMSDGIPTARPTLEQLRLDISRPELQHNSSDETVTRIPSPLPSPRPFLEDEIVVDEIVRDQETSYAGASISAVNLDRTGMWLAAQSSFMAQLINPTEERDDESALLQRVASVKAQKEEAQEAVEGPKRKTVRFSEIADTSAEPASKELTCPKPILLRQESAYYRAFQQNMVNRRQRDTFVHRIPRFEAMQSQRVSFPAAHRAQLLGKYQLSVVPMSAKRRMSSNVARGDEFAPEDANKLKSDKEAEAATQMAAATWNVMASKLLNGGRLIAAPVATRLSKRSSMCPQTAESRIRILDLGGQATCDWAWHCAAEYPHAKVYTVTTKALRQLSNSNIRGPSNHRQVAVEKLTRLPFKDGHFDLVSAREIYTILKENGESGEDEWDVCLKECMRVLKPGGYLEFAVMDSDIVNAGPLGLAKSVEFGFSLKTRGYDPVPTKAFVSRLRNAGFANIKRAWVFLPMGAKIDRVEKRDSMGVEVKLELEAMVSGSTEGAASVAGIVGGRAWEKWLLRSKVLAGDESEMEGVSDVVEEGRACGAGWRTVNGWARKPL